MGPSQDPIPSAAQGLSGVSFQNSAYNLFIALYLVWDKNSPDTNEDSCQLSWPNATWASISFSLKRRKKISGKQASPDFRLILITSVGFQYVWNISPLPTPKFVKLEMLFPRHISMHFHAFEIPFYTLKTDFHQHFFTPTGPSLWPVTDALTSWYQANVPT